MSNKSGRYSGFIKPFTYTIDFLTINLLPFFCFTNFNSWYLNLFISLSWVIISLNIKFYEVYRFTKIISIINKIIKQFLLFGLVCYAFFGFYYNGFLIAIILKYILSSLFLIGFFKFAIFYLLKKYRQFFGGNYRNVIIVGSGERVKKLSSLFSENPDYGCNLKRVFKFDCDSKSTIDLIFSYALSNNIDVILYRGFIHEFLKWFSELT